MEPRLGFFDNVKKVLDFNLSTNPSNDTSPDSVENIIVLSENLTAQLVLHKERLAAKYLAIQQRDDQIRDLENDIHDKSYQDEIDSLSATIRQRSDELREIEEEKSCLQRKLMEMENELVQLRSFFNSTKSILVHQQLIPKAIQAIRTIEKLMETILD